MKKRISYEISYFSTIYYIFYQRAQKTAGNHGKEYFIKEV